jgi:hypothetical protein
MVIENLLRESFGKLLRRFTALPEKVQQRTLLTRRLIG